MLLPVGYTFKAQDEFTIIDGMLHAYNGSSTEPTISSMVTAMADDVFEGCEPTLIIMTDAGSYAHTYEETHGIRFILRQPSLPEQEQPEAKSKNERPVTMPGARFFSVNLGVCCALELLGKLGFGSPPPPRILPTQLAGHNRSHQPHAAAAQAPKDSRGEFAEDCFRSMRKFRQSSAT